MTDLNGVAGRPLARVVLVMGAIVFPGLFPCAPVAAESGIRLHSLYEVTPVDRMPRAMRRAYRRAILTKLTELGYLPRGSVSGVRTAVQAYQRDAGLPADGAMSRELLDHMIFVRPETRAGQERVRPVMLAPPVPPRPQEPGIQLKPPRLKPYRLPSRPPNSRSAPDFGSAPAARSAPNDRVAIQRLPPAHARIHTERRRTGTASRGGGGFVSRIQRELTALGYYEGPIDGVYGRSTESAVRRFQKEKGLPVTGAIDARLLNALSIG